MQLLTIYGTTKKNVYGEINMNYVLQSAFIFYLQKKETRKDGWNWNIYAMGIVVCIGIKENRFTLK